MDLGIKIIDMAVNVDHVHLFVKYPSEVLCELYSQRIKGGVVENCARQFHNSRNGASIGLRTPSCFHGSVGHGWEVVERCIQNQEMPNAKSRCTGSVLKSGV